MKIALVTGGNSGIGYATCAELRDRGYQVHLCGRDARRVDEAARELGATPHVADMTRPEELHALGAQFNETGLDALVNSAGTSRVLPIGDYTPEAISRHFDTNIIGPLLLIQALLPALEKRRGAITTLSSIITTHGAPGFGLYAATKGAVDAVTRNLAVELGPRGIRINAVAPGAIETPIFSKVGFSQAQQQMVAQHQAQSTPLGRRGDPAEVAKVIAAQLESTYVSGSVWCVDGGV